MLYIFFVTIKIFNEYTYTLGDGTVLKLLKYLTKKEWLYCAISVVLIAGTVYLELELPSYMSDITTLLTTGGAVKEIVIKGLIMLACALGSAALSVIIGYFVAKVAAGLSARLRAIIFSKVQSFSNAEIRKFSTASLITRTTNDVTQIQNLVSFGMQSMIRAPIMAVWAIVIILGKSWEWSVLTASAVGLLMIVILTLVLFVMPKFKKLQTQTDSINRIMRENLTGVRVVRAYNAEQFEEKRFGVANEDLTKTHLFTSRFMVVLNPFMNLMMSGLSLGIYWLGAIIIQNANVSLKLTAFSDMVVFMSYAMQVVMAFILLTMIFIMLPRATVSARRINEIIGTKSAILDGEGAEPISTGEVEFKNVSFKYPDADEYVLQDISFKAERGQTVAFIGSTGSGKSTLINLVPRIYDATEGEVLVDGVNVKDYKLSQLNDIVGYVPQKAFLFSGTIKSNLQYGEIKGEKASEESYVRAAKIAQASSFIEKKEDKYDSEITQGGTNVSGGQKQRLAIARAIARNPEIMIFDDSFSALDFKTDKRLRQAIKRELKSTTNLIVAQRIGTIKDADLIIVLDNGKMVGKGKHEELMKKCSVYREIATSQLSKEELA